MIYDIIIVGAASAGLTSGIYAGRKKLNTVILSKQVGGQSLLTDTIENFPGFDSISGQELISKMRAQVDKYGVELKDGVEVESIRQQSNSNFLLKIKGGEEMEAKSVIIATGKNPRHLGVPGEDEFLNKGVSFCSICDAPLFGDKDVAVVGGGNAGLGSAMDLTKYANNIYVLEHGPKIRGDELTQEKLQQTGKVKFITNADVQEIQGSNLVEKVVYKDSQTGEIKELAVGGVFVNIGWIPATGFVEGFLDMDKRGAIVVDPKTTETSVSGVYAAGDAANIEYHQCVIAAGEGAKAALSAHGYLLKKRD